MPATMMYRSDEWVSREAWADVERRADKWIDYPSGERINEPVGVKVQQLRATGYHNVGLDWDCWYSPGSQPFHPTLTLLQAHRQMVANEPDSK